MRSPGNLTLGSLMICAFDARSRRIGTPLIKGNEVVTAATAVRLLTLCHVRSDGHVSWRDSTSRDFVSAIQAGTCDAFKAARRVHFKTILTVTHPRHALVELTGVDGVNPAQPSYKPCTSCLPARPHGSASAMSDTNTRFVHRRSLSLLIPLPPSDRLLVHTSALL